LQSPVLKMGRCDGMIGRSAVHHNHCFTLAESLAQTVASASMSEIITPKDKKSAAKRAKAPSPFLAQYLDIKRQHVDALLFFRMGDFYELFFQDAVDAAEILGITLTARGEYQGKPIPMAGVPFHAAEGYLARLISSGRTIAVCEQTETPAEAKKRGYKAIVNREIVRIVTPGTITEDSLLASRQAHILAAISFGNGGRDAGLSWCDVSTGAFEMLSLPAEEAGHMLSGLAPREILLSETEHEHEAARSALELVDAPLTLRPARGITPKSGEKALQAAFKLASLDAIGRFSRCELSAAALLLSYLDLTQAGEAIRLDLPRRNANTGLLAIDPATRASLEIDQAMAGTRDGSLIHAIDRTLTAPGARTLAERLTRPSTDITTITERHDAIGWCLDDPDLTTDLRTQLRTAPDLERARGRLRLGRGGPRDLKALGLALKQGELAAAMIAKRMRAAPTLIEQATTALTLSLEPGLDGLARDLKSALADDVPLLARDGNFIALGWDAALDEARCLRDDSRKVIAGLQTDYAKDTGVSALKIKFNNVLGYFVEVSARFAEGLMAAPLNERFIHRQTLANVVRFSTSELAELAGRISRAEEEAKARELAIFAGFVERLEPLSGPLQKAAAALAELDVATAGAVWAEASSAVRPQIVDAPVFEAEGLRHPVVEAALKKQGDGFTANDTRLDASGTSGPRLQLVTGPNMAGKSTYLRQCALAVILAQAGFYVPARALTLGLADRIFSRVGASDDLARGRSTFMVEMVETAAILNQATPASFVILDEVGRGTSTYDGLAIAWAAVEHLHNKNTCRALFATHYHELTTLASELDGAANVSLRAKEWQDGLVFLHDVQPGPADKSYGVQVAKLAGLPKAAVRRAEQVLKTLEADPARAETLPLFAATPAPAEPLTPEPVSSEADTLLAAIDPDTLTPREALDLVYKLKSLAPG
jgi:DNA mismatch repair protein MutS